MARARNIKPKFFTNEDLAELAYEARLLFIGTWTLADREGRLEDRPKKIKMEVFPADSVDVDRLLQKLHDGKFIVRYEAGGKRYIQVLAFKKHQSPHFKEPPSTIPEPEVLPPFNEGANPGQKPDSKRAKPRVRPTSKGGRTALIPDSGFLDSGLLNPESPSPSTDSAAARRGNGAEKPDTAPTWAAYREAYRQRYSVEPAPNAEDNAHMLAFVKKVPLAEAPEIAAFYVRHDKGWYVTKSHAVKFLRDDATGLRTQWLTGRKVTDSRARQADQTATNVDQINALLDQARREKTA